MEMKRRGRPKGQINHTFENGRGSLADTMRYARIAQELGLREVAEACSCTIQFISNIERGKCRYHGLKLSL